MKAEIISVSNDLLIGKTQDQNMPFLAKELMKLGIDVQRSSVIRDSPDLLVASLEQAEKQADLIVLLGGSGSDQEAILKQTLSDYLAQPLVLDQLSEDSLLNRNVIELTVGLFMQTDDQTYLLLPGLYDELRLTYLEEVKPLLMEKRLNNSYVETRVLRLFGLSEAELDQKIASVLGDHVAIFPIQEEFEIQINVQEKDKKKAIEKADAIKAEVYELVKDYVFADKSQSLLATVKELLTEEGLMITAAESLTGGELLSALSSLESSSQILNGGMVTYSNEVKNENLGVTKKTIEQHGVVSAQCAIEMAENVMKAFKVDIGVSLTGVAGPASLEGKVPGTVWIGLAKEGMETVAKKYNFTNDRNKNRKISVQTALDLVRRLVLGETIEGTVTMETVDEDEREALQ